MTVIKQDDLIQSIADALQFISYYHPTDFIRAMREAWEREESPAAKAALTQVLVNSRMCAIGKRPICQDTGIVNVLICVGMDVQWDADMALEDMINEGVRRAYTQPDNTLRASILEAQGRSKPKGQTAAVLSASELPNEPRGIRFEDAAGRVLFALARSEADRERWLQSLRTAFEPHLYT